MTFSRREFIRTGGLIAASLSLSPVIMNGMDKQQIFSTDDLKIVPSKTSSKSDFDFYPGNWTIRVRRLKRRFQSSIDWIEDQAAEEIRPILGGLGLIGQFRQKTDDAIYEGMALHLFDPATKLWSNYWADSDLGFLEPAVTGSFEKNAGVFYGKDVFENKPIDVMYKWDLSDRNNPVWSQAFSNDGGKTWETNLIMHYSKANAR
jgi:hypothetical protein